MNKTFFNRVVIYLVVLFLAGGVQGFKAVAAEKPIITSVTPANRAYNVKLNQKMTVKFSMDIDISTANSNNVKVNDGVDLISNITTSSPREMIIEFKNLEYFKQYVVTMENIKSMQGEFIDKRTTTFATRDTPILIDYDFETSDQATPAVAGITNANSLIDTTPHTGAHALKFQIYKDNRGWAKAGWYKQNELDKPGKAFKISFWANMPGYASNSDIKVWLNSSNSINIGTIDSVAADSNWHYCSFIYTMPNNFSGDCLFSFTLPGKNDLYDKDWGILYLDDLLVELVGDTKLVPVSKPSDYSINVPLSGKDVELIFTNDIETTDLASKFKVNGASPFGVAMANGSKNIVKLDLGSLNFDKRYMIEYNLKDEYGKDASGVWRFTALYKYGFDSLEFYKDYGLEELKFTNLMSGNISAVVSGIKNNSPNDGEVLLMVALYKNNAMIDAKHEIVAVPANTLQAQPFAVTLNVPALSDGDYYLKAFLLDEFNGIQPIGTAKIAK